jgi:type IV pilus assembly protein PilV
MLMTSAKNTGIASRNHGFSLVEVLVALLVLSIGLLGLAALQTTSLQYNTGSYFRTQATFLAYDIIDRMRANLGAVANSDGNGYDQPTSANVTAGTNCDTTACSAAQLALYDVKKWYDRAVATLPEAANSPPTIQVDTGNVVTITINWRERDLQMSQAWRVQL